MTVEYQPYPPSFYHIDKLKSLTKSVWSASAAASLYILANYQTPEKIANMRAYEPLRKLSRGRFTMSDFIQLKALAKNTVGATNDYLLDQICTI